jgi:hypothetical protein
MKVTSIKIVPTVPPNIPPTEEEEKALMRKNINYSKIIKPKK